MSLDNLVYYSNCREDQLSGELKAIADKRWSVVSIVVTHYEKFTYHTDVIHSKYRIFYVKNEK